jgi:ADP-heptose:LPS heptosyltransferase
VAEDACAPLVTGHRAVDRVVRWPRMRAADLASPDPAARSALRAAIASLRAEPYDVALDLQGLARSAWIQLLSRAPIRLGVAEQREGAHLVAFAVPVPSEARHAVDRYLAVAAHLGAAPRPVRFDLPVDAADACRVASRLAASARSTAKPKLVVVTPSPSSLRKAPPAAWWREIVRDLAASATVVVIGDAARRARHRDIGGGIDCLDWTGETTVGEAVALLARADLHVGPDSGMLHVSAALGRPTIGVYGPTRPEDTGPYGAIADVVQATEACDVLCRVACRSAARCLAAIDAGEVIRRARRALDRAKG